MKKYLLLTITMLIAVVCSQAANLTVGSGGTYATIQAAITAAQPGDVITVAAGIYAENITISKSLTISGANKATTIIEGDNTGVVVTIAAINTTFQNFTVQKSGFDPDLHAGILLYGVTGCTVNNNIVQNNINNIALIGSSNNTVSNNSLLNGGLYGLWIGNDALNVTSNTNSIMTNTVTATGRAGIYVDKNCTSNSITGNTISGTVGNGLPEDFEGNGIYLWKSGATTVTANIISGNATNGMELSATSGHNIASNTITGNAHHGIRLRATTGVASTGNTFTLNTISSNILAGIFLETDASQANTGSITQNTITNNAIGLHISSANIDATAWTVENNSFSTNASNVTNAGTGSLTATCNWWGTAVPAEIAAKITGAATYVPYKISEGGACAGGLPVLVVRAGTTVSGHATIQEAITAAQAGDVITVAAGTYTETGQIVIDKNLTIVGADKSTTIIKPAQNTGSTLDARGWFLVNSGVTFNMSNLTLNGTGKLVWDAILTHGTGTIDNCIFTEIKYNPSGPDYRGAGLRKTDAGSVNVTNCQFSQMGRNGIIYINGGSGTASGNTYTGKGAGEWLDYAFDAEYGGGMTLDNNQVTNVLGTGGGEGSAAVTVWDDAGTSATLTNNTFTNNSIGLAVAMYGGTEPTVVIGNGNVFDGGEYGVDLENIPGDAVAQPVVTFGASTFKNQTKAAIALQKGISAGTVIDISSCIFKTAGDAVITDNFAIEDLLIHAIDAPNRGLFKWNGNNVYITANSYATPTTTAPSIQRGINAATAAWTVNVAAGTYSETIPLVIDKNLTITGAGKTSTTIKPANSEPSDNALSSLFKVTAGTLNLSYLKIDGDGYSGTPKAVRRAVRTEGTGAVNVDNCVITNIKQYHYEGYAFALTSGTNTISNTEMSNIERVGIFVLNPTTTATATGCTYTGKGVGDFTDNAYESNNAVLNMTNCTATNCKGIAASDGSSASGLVVWSAAGAPGGVATVTACTFSNNNVGVAVGILEGDISHATISTSKFSGNTEYGITCNQPGNHAIAINNWWGDASGPYHAVNNSCGLGNAVTDNVSFMPWYTSDAMTTTANLAVHNTTKDIYYCKIQDAVNGAAAADVIEVGAGTYAENISFGKSLTLRSAAGTWNVAADQQTILTGTTPVISFSGCSNVTLDGFLFSGITDGGNQNVIYSSYTDHVTISDNKFDNFEHLAIESTGNSDWTVTGNTFNNIHGAGTLGEAIYFSSVPNVTVTDNVFSNLGYAALQFDGASANALISGNTFSNIANQGINLGKMNGATISDNIMTNCNSTAAADKGAILMYPTGGTEGVTGTITITGNIITNTSGTGLGNAIVVKPVGTNPLMANVVINRNKLAGNAFGVKYTWQTGGTTISATNNWWGDASGPDHVAPLPVAGTGVDVSPNINFIPWACTEAMTSACPPLDPGMLIMNTTTGEQYGPAELPAALNEAADGQTLYVAEGTVHGTTVSLGSKTVYMIGTGVPGQSILEGASPSLTVTTGNLIIENGITLFNNTDAPTILVTGGTLTLRDCIIHETPGFSQACLEVTGGSVDAGTSADHGRNQFIVHGAGAAVKNTQETALPAEYNDWGSAHGPTIASNVGGDGGAIVGAGDYLVDYDPWGGGPITTISTVSVCSGATYVDFPVTVAQFNEVGSFSLRFAYNDTELTTPSLLAGSLQTDIAAWGHWMMETGTSGIVTVSNYAELPTGGVNLADGTSLFTLRFNLLTATTSTLAFAENLQGTACEFTGVAPEYSPYGDAPAATNYISGTVTVVPDPSYANYSFPIVDLCVSHSVNFSVTVENGLGGTLSWIRSTTSGGAGVTVTSPDSPPGLGTFYYRPHYEPTGNGCNLIDGTETTVTIYADPTIETQPAPLTQVCVDGTVNLSVTAANGIGGYIYQWYSNTVSNNTTGSVILDATASTYTAPTATAGTVYYYAQAWAGGLGCSAATSDIAQVVTLADPTIATHPAATSNECIGGNIQLSVTAANGTGTYTYQWYSNVVDNYTSGSEISGATASTYTPPTATAGTVYYYVIVGATGIGCGTATSTVATVNTLADPSIATEPVASTTVCLDGAVVLSVTAANGTGDYSYQWYSNTTNSETGSTLIGSATASSYTAPTASTGTVYYYVVVGAAGNGCGTATSIFASVTTVDEPTVATQPTPASTVCVGATVNLSVTAANGTGAYTYQWYANANNNNTGGSAIDLATASSYTAPTTAAGTVYYYAIVGAAGVGCGTATSDVAQVVTVADPSIATQPAATTNECIGGTLSLSVTAADGTGAYSYQWYTNAVNNNTSGTEISGATASTYTPPSATAGTVYYYVIVGAAGSGCGTATSTVATVNTLADPTIDTEPVASTTVCLDGSVVLSVTAANGTGDYTYQWYSNTTNSESGSSLIGSATASTYTAPTASTGTVYYYVIVGASGNGCGTATSAFASVTTVAEPSVDAQPTPLSTVCVGATVNLSVTAANGTGAYTYQWYANAINNNTGGSAIDLATASSYTAPTAAAGTVYYYAIVGAAGVGCGTATSDVAQVVTVADPSIATHPAATTNECIGGTLSLSVTAADGTGAYSYQWYTNAVNNNTSGTEILDATASNYTPPSATAGTVYYYVIVGAAGSGCGTATSTVATVNIWADPSIATDPVASTTVCLDGSVILDVTAADGTGSYTYQWYSNTSSSYVGSSLIGSATASSYTAPTASTGTVYYYVIVGASGNGCGTATSAIASVIVVSDPSITSQPVAATTICATGSVVLSVTAGDGTGNYTYAWYANASNNNTTGTIIADATSSSYTVPTAAAGTLYYYVIVGAEGVGCGSTTSSVAAVTVQARQKISGNFKYYNLALTPLLTGITVKLYQDNVQVGSDYLVTAGTYEFTGICPGTYEIRATSNSSTTGSVNTTDAAQVNYWPIAPYAIEKVRFHAGDVGTSGASADGSVNATDAGRIQTFFVTAGLTTFDRPWTFWKTGSLISANPTAESYPTVTLPVGADVVANMYGLCTGDFNRSYTPAKAFNDNLALVLDNTQPMNDDQEFEMPIRLADAASVGAISLILNFPAELVTVKDVLINSADAQAEWAVDGNELRIGWYALTPLNLAAGDVMLTLRLATTAAFTDGKSIEFSLAGSPLNELADAQYNVIPQARIIMNGLKAGINSLNNSANLSLSNHPNPFTGNTMISYELPFDGTVSIEIYNYLGSRVETLLSENQTAGYHSLSFDAAALPAGIYTATLTLKNNNNNLVRTIKLLSNK